MSENTYDYDEDRGSINEPKKRSSSVINGIVILGIVLVGMAAAYWVIFESKKPQVVEEKKPILSELVPDYEIPPPEPKPKPKLKPEPKKPVLKPVKKPVKATPKKDDYLERLLAKKIGSDDKKKGNLSKSNLRQSNEDRAYQNINLSVTETPLVQASRLPNLNWLVPKGVPIPCAMNMAIQSDQSGLLTCTTTEDIYSSDGTVILIDRGSSVTGEYRSSSLRLGMRRVFAIWDRIRTPDGVVVQINSPAAGGLGRAGIGGYVDNHYLERFGAAILVSLLDDALEESTGNSRFDNTEDEFRNVSVEFLNQYRSIRPTLHKPQGGEINIIVARDLDLSSVYELSRVK